MKKVLLIVLSGILLLPGLCGQVNLFLEEKQVILPDGKATGWVFPVNHDLDAALDDLKDYCKDRSDVKMKNGGDNILIAEMISLPAITTMRGDLIGFGRISEQDYTMSLVFRLGYDISVDSKTWEDEMENLRNYAKSFMTYHYEQHYARIIEDLEKVIKGFEKDKKQDENKVESLTKKMNNLSKKIAKETETEKINEMESEINTIESDIQVIMDTLPEQEERLAELRKEVDQNKKESNAYLSAISGF